MKNTAAIAGPVVLIALVVAVAALAQPQPHAPNQAAVIGEATPSSSEKVRENPAAQYLLVKTVVAQA
ncbi:MAG: hypothetical protein ISP49_22585, partial [Reyranella sp.]|nr:hypothetical protein [Reyranella sp.]